MLKWPSHWSGKINGRVTLAGDEKKTVVTMCVTSHFASPHLHNGNGGLDDSLITDKVK